VKTESFDDIKFAPGNVYHGREGKLTHRFRYPLFYIFFPVDKEESLQKLLADKFKGLLGFDSRYYLFGQHSSLDSGVREILRTRCQYEAEEIWLQTIPKMMGYVFNPVSFWYCYRGRELDSVLCEVRNTFGEKHFYFLRLRESKSTPSVKPDGPSSMENTANDWVRSEKVFHVSPFFPVKGHYLFRFRLSATNYQIQIKYQSSESELLLLATTEGSFEPLEHVGRMRIFLKYGWMTPLVVFRIHYQAFWLWIKKATFHKKPEPPKMEITS
jgi:uncharacterized protein